jgi:hypothetical protein
VTTPGALPPPRSVYEAPAIAPIEQTPAQQAAYQLAVVAATVAAAGASKKAIADQTTLLLIPLLRAINPFDDNEVAAFAAKAAELIELGRQETARVAWGALSSQLSAYGVNLPANYLPVGQGRRTRLDEAYKRVAGDYRKRMAAGTDSIKGLIAQMEEERFQQLGGAVVAQGRTGESNAKIEGTKRSPTASGSSSSKAASGSSGSSGSSSSSTGTAGGERARPLPKDRDVNRQVDDWDAEDAAATAARAAEDAADDAAFEAEQELRRQAALNEFERQQVLEQAAQHDMEMRTERMVNDDMAMASRQATLDAMQSAPRGVITGYRRVLHPELSESGVSCGLCVAASHRKYSVRELMPIHNLCKCEAVPIINGKDPGAQINREDLGALYDEAGGSTDRQDLAAEKYTVFHHPELGPVLRNQKHSLSPIGFSPREASDAHKTKVRDAARAFQEKRAESFGTSN